MYTVKIVKTIRGSYSLELTFSNKINWEQDRHKYVIVSDDGQNILGADGYLRRYPSSPKIYSLRKNAEKKAAEIRYTPVSIKRLEEVCEQRWVFSNVSTDGYEHNTEIDKVHNTLGIKLIGVVVYIEDKDFGYRNKAEAGRVLVDLRKKFAGDTQGRDTAKLKARIQKITKIIDKLYDIKSKVYESQNKLESIVEIDKLLQSEISNTMLMLEDEE